MIGTSEMVKFWNELKKKNVISIKDFEELEKYLANVYQQMEDIIKSRDNWKNKYMELKDGVVRNNKS